MEITHVLQLPLAWVQKSTYLTVYKVFSKSIFQQFSPYMQIAAEADTQGMKTHLENEQICQLILQPYLIAVEVLANIYWKYYDHLRRPKTNTTEH